MNLRRSISSFFACFSLAMLAGPGIFAGALAADELPATTPDGLELMSGTKVRAVYAKPGATLEPYTKVALLDCQVAFRKNWERDYNRDASFDRRVHADDMERIKSALAEEFKKVFTDELTKGGYEIVDYTGDDVLIVRPALVNLDVTAPDVMSASRSRSYVTSAGSMTLYMELYDSVTGDIIARVLDPEAADRGGFAMEANRVTNRAEADRILRKWAGLLRSHLGTVQEATTTAGG
jgi:hypothetical protein